MTGRTKRLLAVAVLVLAGLLSMGLWQMPVLAAWQWRANAGAPSITTSGVHLVDTLHWFDDYYVVSDLGDGAYAIGEPRYGQCNFSYVIVGSRQALLFDTGPGVRDIRAVVASLTALPIEALPSHLHFDHVGNLGRFADVALPDLPALRRQAHGQTFELGYYQHLGFVEGLARPNFTVTKWVAPNSELDLGDRRLTVVSLPGHTPDSVVLVDRAANRVFAGDFIYPSEIYAQLPGSDLRDYAASARRLATLIDGGTRIYGAHGCEHLPDVTVPQLNRADVVSLANALVVAASSSTGPGWYPRRIPVNDRMVLLAKYPWMHP